MFLKVRQDCKLSIVEFLYIHINIYIYLQYEDRFYLLNIKYASFLIVVFIRVQFPVWYSKLPIKDVYERYKKWAISTFSR